MNKKDSYEELINQSPVFGMDQDQDPVLYKTECNRLIKYIYLYMTEARPNVETDGMILMETVTGCLKYYNPETGPFLHYFRAAFKKNTSKTESRDKLDKRTGGLHLTRSERLAALKVCRYLDTHPGVCLEDLIQLLDYHAANMGMTGEELKHAVLVYRACQVESGDAPIGDGDSSGTRFDMVRDEGAEFVDLLIAGSQVLRILELIEEEYLKSTVPSKEFLSIKLTSALAFAVQDDLEDEIRNKRFFHEKTWLYVSASGKSLKNKEIGKLINKSEANITQIWKRFTERLRNRLQEEL